MKNGAAGMIGASIYIVACTARNRLRLRLRRLREPRYLLGAIAGAAYLYFTVFARVRGGRAARARRENAPSAAGIAGALQGSAPGLAAMGVLALAALAWAYPVTSGLLDFTPAETDLLLPAPVSRRALLLHRFVRSQIGLLFAAMMPAIFMPSTGSSSRVKVAVTMWLALVTGKVYFAGVSLARARLTSRRRDDLWIAAAPLLVLGAIVAITAGSIWRGFDVYAIHGPADVVGQLGRITTHGAAGVVLIPFLTLVRPMFAPWPWPFLRALVPATLVLAVVIAWVLKSDAAFEEAMAAVSARRAAVGAPAETASPKARAAPWTLAARGPAESLLLWKNAIQMLRATTGGALIRYIVPLFAVSVFAGTAMLSAARARGTAITLCSLAVGVAAFAILLGPQVLRVDLRDDLRHLELLKTWPIRPAAVIRGEMLCPGVVLTSIAWFAICCAGTLSAAGFPRLSLGWRLSGSIAAMLIAPALVFAQLTVHNAAAVVFPAWVPLGNSRPRGLDAMGQRLILFGAVILTLVFMMIPGVIAAAVVWLIFQRIAGAAVLIPAAVACLIVVGVEVLAATEVLGPALDRIDLTAVERPE